MRCYFCEIPDMKAPVSRIRITGKDRGKRKQKRCCICAACTAIADNDWIAGQLGWDGVVKITALEKGGKS